MGITRKLTIQFSQFSPNGVSKVWCQLQVTILITIQNDSSIFLCLLLTCHNNGTISSLNRIPIPRLTGQFVLDK